jgi:hypothetical protein
LESNGLTSWNCHGSQYSLIPAIKPENPLYESILAIKGETVDGNNPYARLQEKSISEVLEEKRNSNNMVGDDLINRALEREVGVNFREDDQ